MVMETAVLGAGAAGLTLAMRLALRGDRVTLVEREPQPGGLAAGFAIGQATLEKFYHHLFRTDTAIVKLIDDIGLGADLEWRRPVTATLVGGQRWELDSAASVLRFAPLPLFDRLRMGASIAALKLWPDYHLFEPRRADPWLRGTMGARAYEMAWKPLLAGKFGEYATQISLAWFWSRIHCRTRALGYLRGGFQRFYNRMAEVDTAMGAQLHFATSVTKIEPTRGNKLRVATTNGEIVADRVVSTLPTHLALKLAPTLPTFARRYDQSVALGAHCLILALDRALTDIYWLNIADAGFPFLALVEHTNFIPTDDYGGRHLIYLGNYLPMSHPLFTQSKDEVLAEYLPALSRINPSFSPHWVTESWMFAAPFAQPVVTPDFHKHIPPHETPIPNLYLANMFQVYPQDRGQNYAVAMAIRLADRLAQTA
jgi:protoporphyrinogen oxidase